METQAIFQNGFLNLSALLLRASSPSIKSMQDAISEAGFEPQLRNQEYQWRELPSNIEEQVIDY